MRILVVYESRCGATQGIAERIAEILRDRGLQATVQPAHSADDPARYDAVVIGSAAYYFHWMKRALEYVRRHHDVLANPPVWLFSSGPLGREAIDAQGRDVRDMTIPKDIAEFQKTINPRDHRVFFGAMDHSKLPFPHRLVLKLPVNRDNAIFPEGDFRDWHDIEKWAGSIADSLNVSADNGLHQAHQPEVLAVAAMPTHDKP